MIGSFRYYYPMLKIGFVILAVVAAPQLLLSADRLPKPDARLTPPRTRSPAVVNKPPSVPTLKPEGALPSLEEAIVVNVPVNGVEGRPAAPTRFEMLNKLKT